MTSRYIFGKEERVPKGTIPVARLDGAAFESPPADGLRLTWMGHSSVLVELDGKRILTDPVWSKRVSPIGWMGPARFHEPPIGLEELPRINVDPRAIRKAYLEELNRFLGEVRKVCLKNGVDYVELHTDMLLDVALAEYLATRASSRGSGTTR